MEIIGAKYRVTEMKKSLGGLKLAAEVTEERSSKLEDRSMDFTQFKQQRKKHKKNKPE